MNEDAIVTYGEDMSVGKHMLNETLTRKSVFDTACDLFTERMYSVAMWKHTFPGAAYSTRLRMAIECMKIAQAELEIALDADDAQYKRKYKSEE